MSDLMIQPDTATGRELLEQVERQLFFIVGAARSGTSLLQAMITSHPDTTIPNETGFFPVIRAKYSGDYQIETAHEHERVLDFVLRHPRIKAMDLNTDEVRELALAGERTWESVLLALLAAYARQHGKRRIGEKSPRHVSYLRHLSQEYPHARFIHLVRDPRAVVLSLSKVHFGGPFVWRNIRNYQLAYEAHKRYATALGDRYLLLRYEDLVTDRENQLRTVCAFLSLDFDTEMLEHHHRQEKGFADWQQAHMANTLRPVFTSSIDKWKTELKPRWIALIDHFLGDAIDEFGYERTGTTTYAPRLQMACSRAACYAAAGTRRLFGRRQK